MRIRQAVASLRPVSLATLLGGVSLASLLLASTPAPGLPLGTMRGGSGAFAATANAAAAAMASVQQAQQATQQSMSSLNRAVQAVQAMQQAQAQARALVQQTTSAAPGLPSVPNGLTPGGLVPAYGLGSYNAQNPDPNVWVGANAPSQSTSNGQTLVEVQQTQQKAILTWTSFNVGKNTELYFNQSAGNSSTGNNWIALNRVIDPSGVPSQILGQIKAEGTVYVINRNGIIFGGTSQVNVSSLIASSLNFLGENLINQIVPGSAAWDTPIPPPAGSVGYVPGSVADANKEFLTNGITDPGNHGIPFLGSTSPAGFENEGDITVEAGAQIEAGNLGYAMLAAPNVSNAGTILAPDGQVILAAGMQVTLPQPSTATTSWLSPFLTGGLPVTNGVDSTPLFTVTNTGLVQATTGNITLIGAAVDQAGVVEVTTGITRPGAITISAQDDSQGVDVPGRTGPITFTAGSVTAILPEEDGETTTSDQSANAVFVAGKVGVAGSSITFDDGALMDVPGGSVSLSASEASPLTHSPLDPTIPGRIFIDDGAVIDVSGLANVELPMSDTLVPIGPLTADDLADSPLQRNGFLLSQTVVVDSTISGTRSDGEAWVGSPLINAQGYVDEIPRSIDQMLVNAGSLTLSGGEVITAPGSTLNLMGGYIHYLGGTIATTRLIDASGNIVNIADADPNDTFVGFAGEFTVDHAHWGITEIFGSKLLLGGTYAPDLIQGGNAGALNVYGAAVLDGDILASFEAGRNQKADGVLPQGGALTIGSSTAPNEEVAVAQTGTEIYDIDPNFSAVSALGPVDDPTISETDPGYVFTTTLSAPLLNAVGFSSISIDAARTISIAAPLTVRPGGSISLTGGAVQVNADLTAPGGTISIVGTGYVISLSSTGTIPSLPFDGNITIGPGAELSAAGRWVNDSGLYGDDITGPADINGGSISLVTIADSVQPLPNTEPDVDVTGSIDLQQGSILDVSSGGYIAPNGALQGANGIPAGKGGSITLETYNVVDKAPFGVFGGPRIPSQQPSGGEIVLDGILRGFGFSGGGTLTLQTLGIQIGGDPASAPSYDLVLPANFFSSQGFGAYNLTAVYDATVVSGTTVAVSEKNFIPNISALLNAPTGTNLYGTGGALPDGSLVSIGSLDPFHRQAADFSLNAGTYLSWSTTDGIGFAAASYPGVTGTLLLGEGASILADPGASVSLNSYNQLTDLGTIVAPGGTIALTGTPAQGSPTSGSVWLGADAVLDASGVALINPLAPPIRTLAGDIVPVTGEVLDGGTVSVLDGTGTVIAEAGSRIDVSGTSATFDVPQSIGLFGSLVDSPTLVWSNAGSITLGGNEGLLFDGALVANAGAPSAEGGTLTLTGAKMTGLYQFNNTQATAIVLQQSGTFVPASLQPGPIATSAIPGFTAGDELFAVDRLDGSGIDSLVVGADPVVLANDAIDGASSSTTPSQPLEIGFAGNVSINLGRSFVSDATEYVSLAAGASSIPTNLVGGASVSISAPYVDFGGAASTTPPPAATDGSLTIHAGTLDLTGQIALENFSNADFVSSGDTRLYTLNYAKTSIPDGELTTAGNLTFQAAQLYPATANTFIIDAVGPTVNGAQLPTTVTFLPGGNASSVPLSAGGSLLVDATNIVQDGTVRVPLGTLVLGVSDTAGEAGAFNGLPLTATQSVSLGAGSITSVSLDGATVPYGTTVDGLDWQYQIYDPAAVNPTFPDLTAPPAKSISLAGTSLALDPGATVDLSGGGTIYAAEWVSGTGGSRNLLLQSNTVYQSGATPTQVPLYPDDRPVYAVIPGYNSPVAPVDEEMATDGAAVGEQVYLSGVPGLPAGIYTLLPGQYATMPGAYRVVQQTGTVNSLASQNVVLPDGSGIAEGYFVDGLTGARSAQTTSFLVQSASVWGQYSQYTITNANSYFASQATEAGTAIPRLPQDAGQLALAASNALTLGATLQTQPGVGGQGALVDITSQDIQIVGNGEAALPGYLQISADALDQLGAASLLIGGTRSGTSTGEMIDATANSVVVSNDAADPLIGPEVIIVTKTDSPQDDPNAPNGLLVETGSVIEARGPSAETPETITIGQNANSTTGAAAISGDGALLAVSQNGILGIIRNDLPASPQGLLTVQGGVTLAGGAGLTLDASGNTLVDPSAVLSGKAIAADSGLITFVPGISASGLSGMVIGAGTLAQFANADEVILRSYGAIDFEGNINVDVANNLELSAGSFTSGADGIAGNVSITASTLTLANDLGAAAPANAPAGSGSLSLNGAEIDFGSASQGASTTTFSGFGSVAVNAVNGIVGQGEGTLNFGNLPVSLTAPVILAGAGGNATLTTKGALTLNATPAAGATSAVNAFGGAITLIGGSLTDNTLIQVKAGNVTLEATGGDLDVNGTVDVSGFAEQFFDTAAYAPAGNISLTASAGNVNIASGAVLDFAGAQRGGSAGTLTLSAPQGVVNLAGTLQGGAAPGYPGGSFTLNTGGAVDLDALAATLATSGVNQLLSVTTGAGNLVLSAGNTLKAENVALTANGGTLDANGNSMPSVTDGNIIINGTIDVSGSTAGEIALYGKSGVDIEGTLLAISTTPAQVGGNVTIGTTGTPDGTLNSAYGYENVSSASSGTITIGANAEIENWGGRYGTSQSRVTIGLGTQNLQTQPGLGLAAGDTINVIDRKNGDYMGGAVVSYNSTTGALTVNVTNASGAGSSDDAWSINGIGGMIQLRAPLTEDGNVNINISPSALLTAPSAIAIEPYAVWSTTDNGTTPAQQAGGSEHFDGIVDAAGWYQAAGPNGSPQLVGGTFTDGNGSTIATYTPGTYDPATGTWTAATLSNDPGATWAQIKSDLANDLTNDYFTPTNANAAHTGFYGYQSDGTTPGTLMSFIESLPLSLTAQASLQAFAQSGNLQGILQIRPGIELVNPASSGVNSGNISIVTNWNLGAGTSPTSLAYRYNYNGQSLAPIISFLAGNDLNIDASITDGFYQQNTGAVLAALPPTSTTYADAVAQYDMTMQQAPLGSSASVYFYDGSSTPFAQIDPNSTLSAPLPGQASQYYQNYFGYLGYYETWYSTVSIDGGFAQGSFFSPNPTLASPPNPANYTNYSDYVSDYQRWVSVAYPAAPNPANYTTYSLYDTAYSSWLQANFTSANAITATPPAPTPPIQPQQYGAAGSVVNAFGDGSLAPSGTYGDALENYYSYVYYDDYDPATFQNPYVFAPSVPTTASSGGSAAAAAANNSPSNMPAAGNPASFASATLLGGSSSSYRFVAGADLASANPLSVVASATAASINLDGHFSVQDTAAGSNGNTLEFPTTVRTGTGSIDLAAADDIVWQDSTAPAAIYTGGEPAPGTPVSTGVTVFVPAAAAPYQGDFISTGEVHPIDAGDITISAGGDIDGVEQVFDTTGDITGKKGAYIGQTWWEWMESANTADGSSINFAAFDQGVMSAGGNVSVVAGGNISELSVSLPTTWYAATGLSGNVVTLGGGDLTVSAGGNILSGTYFVAQGTGALTAGGEIGPDFTISGSYESNTVVTSPVSTLLGYQDTNWTVTARQDADIGGVYDPSYLENPLRAAGFAPDSQNPSSTSSLSILSINGDAKLDTMALPTALLGGQPSDGYILPASLAVVALGGGVDVDGPGALYPSSSGQLTLLADQSVSIASDIVGDGAGPDDYLGVIDELPNALPSPADPLSPNATFPFSALLAPGTGLARYAHAVVHPNGLVRIYALNGNIIDGTTGQGGGGFYSNSLVVEPNMPAFVEAGNDIVNLSFLGENLDGSDVTRIVAGRDIYDPTPGAVYDDTWTYYLVPAIELQGPGYLDVEAGRNIGPLTSANAAYAAYHTTAIETGIETVGNLDNALLPDQSASISILFGIGKGINDAGFADAYIDPSALPIPGIQSLSSDLVTYVDQIEKDELTRAGLPNGIATPTAAQAWAVFEALPQYQQQAFIDQAFFNVLTQVGADYNNSASPYYHQYARGYDAINVLFPASDGYTQNNLDGGTNGANQLIDTGYFDMRGATVQTQQGGSVNILGPGGEVLVGSSSAPPYVVDSNGKTVIGPNQQGILTLETGDVDIFSDQSLLLAQSRIFTEQGGDMTIWSSNGDINAGEGAKTTSAVPPPQYEEDPDGYFTVDAKSEVTGAGIATLQTIPGDAPGNVYLIAPRGKVDAGAAGIRVSGNLDIAALQVVNAFNIQVQGVTEGVPTVAAPNIGALDSASSASGAATKAITSTGQGNNAAPPPSILIVEIEGYGGDNGDNEPAQQPQRKPNPVHERQSYNTRSPYQVLGVGSLTPEEIDGLAEERRRQANAK